MTHDAASALPTEGATRHTGRAFGASAWWSRRRRAVGWTATAVLAVMLLVHAFAYETFTVPSGSMEPTYSPGEHIVVDKRAGAPHRGDVVVFSGEGSFDQPQERTGIVALADGVARGLGFRPGERDYLKRVIGVGGDEVRVDHDGVMTVNGRRVTEPYLPPQMHGRASREAFVVKVPADALFVLGDNRDASDDSRNHLGDPGGGFVPATKVIGRVAATY